MNILAIDTASLSASCALLAGGALVCEKTVRSGLTHSQTLMPMIDEVLGEAGLSAGEVDLFACTAGPGSFTGLRIGMGTIKGLAYAVGKPVAPVSTLLALATNFYETGLLVSPIMDARRHQVYNGLYRFSQGKMETVAPPRAITVEALAAELCEPVLFVGDGVFAYRDYLQEALGNKARFAPENACILRASSVAVAARQVKAVSAADAGLVYLRKSQAEREREEREKNLT